MKLSTIERLVENSNGLLRQCNPGLNAVLSLKVSDAKEPDPA